MGIMKDSRGSRFSSQESISETKRSPASEPMRTICSGNFPGVHEHSPPTSNSSCWTRPMASSAEFRESIEMPGMRLSSILTTPTCELTSSIVPYSLTRGCSLPTSVPSNRRVRPPSPAPVWTLVILTMLFSDSAMCYQSSRIVADWI